MITTNDSGPSSLKHSVLPKSKPGFSAHPVANELVLLSPHGEVTHALNETAAAVWELCDGRHTPLDMLEELRSQYDGRDVHILGDITAAVLRFQHLGLIEVATASGDEEVTFGGGLASDRPRARFVFGVEDKPYFHWQLGILFESLVGQLRAGWDITLVVCNDHARLSPELARLVTTHGLRVITGRNHAHSHKIDFSSHDGGYVALNRVEALRAIASHVDPEDVICLMDTDVFLYGELNADLFPRGNAMAADTIMSDPLFLGGGSTEKGIDLQKVLAAIGVSTELKRGAVTVFMTGANAKNDKVIKDCFRFAQIIFLLGKTNGLPDHNVWMSEMACFAMAFTANGIDFDLLQHPQFITPLPQAQSVAEGTFFHYYCDANDGHGGPFFGSAWNKQLFNDRNFLAENLESFRISAKTEIERRFFDLAIRARRRLLGPPAT